MQMSLESRDFVNWVERVFWKGIRSIPKFCSYWYSLCERQCHLHLQGYIMLAQGISGLNSRSVKSRAAGHIRLVLVRYSVCLVNAN